uniref:Uncharacterized protein n=1 Tax=Mustela putorius furo TaxID=9669 RepID=M3YSI1_MUSPF
MALTTPTPCFPPLLKRQEDEELHQVRLLHSRASRDRQEEDTLSSLWHSSGESKAASAWGLLQNRRTRARPPLQMSLKPAPDSQSHPQYALELEVLEEVGEDLKKGLEPCEMQPH